MYYSSGRPNKSLWSMHSFVLFHLLGDSTRKFAPRVNLQKLRPLQRAASANRLNSFYNLVSIFRSQSLGSFVEAGHVDNGQRIFVDFVTTGQFVVRQQKKVCLVHSVRICFIEFSLRNVAWCREVDLPA